MNVSESERLLSRLVEQQQSTNRLLAVIVDMLGLIGAHELRGSKYARNPD